MNKNAVKAAAGAILGYGGARSIYPLLSSSTWEKTSFQGTPVSLRAGFAAASALGSGLVAILPAPPVRAALMMTAAGSFAGWLDDQYEDKFSTQGKGLAGHLRALREGKITSGVVKIAVIGAGATAGSIRLLSAQKIGKKSLGEFLANALLLAGTANLINLFDLRPGRALKVVTLLALPGLRLPGSASGIAGALLTASALSLPADLRGETMLGDLGANALGGALGVLLALPVSFPQKLFRAGCVTSLIMLSEKISFSRCIEKNALLSALDNWGRPERKNK